jgi:hypothetical protein
VCAQAGLVEELPLAIRRCREQAGVENPIEGAAAAMLWATLSFYTVIGCHCLSFLTCRDLHDNLAAIAVVFYQNDSVAPG